MSQATSLRIALFATISSLSIELTLLVVGTVIPGAASIVGPGALGVLLAVAASWFVLSGALFALAVCAAGPASPPAPLAVFATVLGFVTGFASIIPAALGIVQLIQLAAAG